MRKALLLRGLAALASVLLVVAALDLTSAAIERRAARTPTSAIVGDGDEPELPIASELGAGEPGDAHALTR